MVVALWVYLAGAAVLLAGGWLAGRHNWDDKVPARAPFRKPSSRASAHGGGWSANPGVRLLRWRYRCWPCCFIMGCLPARDGHSPHVWLPGMPLC